ncbi:uncharacterized protein LOC141642251 [Silene latifolia]|uniref:uncharacterized protein LOC141642251 n=1 Tax=Silene latifolia TaxID=37657 RepID=UPI003D77D529
MGACTSRSKKSSYAWEKDPRVFIQKMKLLQQEINTLLQRREEECEAYERELMLFALKEAEWKKERKKLKDEAKGLRKKLEEKEEKIRMMEDEVDQIIIGKNNENFEGKSSVNSSGIGNSKSNSVVSLSLIEQMKEERTRRDETVEKWKMLYLSIKNELDDLIHKTNQGTIYWRAKEEEKVLTEEMQKELKAKEKKIEALKAEIIIMEKDEYKRKREVDILRQSLKIMSSNKNGSAATPLKYRSKRSFRLNNKSLPKLAFVK